MANENKNQDELNANDVREANDSTTFSGKVASSANSDFRQTEPPKENPFSFKHFLRRDTPSNTINHSQSNTNIVNGNGSDASTGNGTSVSPSKSATTSSLNSTGARPKIPQFQSVNVIQSQADVRMKRSPKFSSFDSQSSLSELADERNMHGSRSNNSFNIDYQFPSSRSYNNYDTEPPSSSPSVKQHAGNRNYTQRSQNNVNNTSNSSEANRQLPDFVQDHLLIEYYNNSDSPSANMSPISGDDFSLDNCDALNGPRRDPFDLPYNRSPNNRRRNNQHSLPLDLPSLDRHHRPVSDLPPDLMDNAAGCDVAVQREETYGPHNEPEITRDQAAIDKINQTLPDFLLSDGLIHSSGRLADVATVLHEEDNQSIVRLQQENERLRNIIIDMESQINHAKNMETQYNVTLAESMEQVEENLFASNQRATEAIGQANKFKQQVKQLTVEVQNLRRENESLRDGGAVGGVGVQRRSSNNKRFAKELRMAASSAENNLRQLLSGVENLRLIASAVEKEDQPDAANLDYLSDSDENEFNEGPAL